MWVFFVPNAPSAKTFCRAVVKGNSRILTMLDALLDIFPKCDPLADE